VNLPRRRALAWAIVVAASGCSLKPVDVESRRELIVKLPADIPTAPTLPATLLVLAPESNPAYDTTQMAYTATQYELAYFARSEWAEKPARMLLDLLVSTLERTRRFRAVVTPPYAGRAAYVLRADILELRQDFTIEPATLRLVMRVELRDGESERIIASRRFEMREAMAEKSPGAGVVAANDAAAGLLRDIAGFVVDNSR
jgi:cholesterol transport system auxiliary component